MAVFTLGNCVRSFVAVCAIALGLLVTACGHSGTSDIVTGPGPGEPDPGVSVGAPIAVIAPMPEGIMPGQEVVLDGSGSYDPDGGAIASYEWAQREGVDVELSDVTSAKASFIAPDGIAKFVFALTVVDDEGIKSAAAVVEVSIVPLPQGDVSSMEAVYVSASLGSDDAARSGSYLQPVATINSGMNIAKERGLGTVYVMNGTYTEEVVPPSGIAIIGGATVFGGDGTVTFSAPGSFETIIQAPEGVAQTVHVQDVNGVRIEGFRILGATASPQSFGISVQNGESIEIISNSFETLGAAGANCRDVSAVASNVVVVSGNRFINSGICDNYIAVAVDGTGGLSIDASREANAITFAAVGAEKYLKAVEVKNSPSALIDGVQVQNEAILSDGVSVRGVVVSNATDVQVMNNQIMIVGAKESVGVLYHCDLVVMDGMIAENVVFLSEALEKNVGIAVPCSVRGSGVHIQRNHLAISPRANSPALIRGIEATALLWPISLDIQNNIVILDDPLPAGLGTMTGVVLAKLGSASVVELVHNTIVAMGNASALHALASDRPDVRFATINNIFFVYGGHPQNAIFMLRHACENEAAGNFCAWRIENNLSGDRYINRVVPLAYFYDDRIFQAIGDVNACEANPEPAPCAAGTIVRRNNVLSHLVPTAFDIASGALTGVANQALVRDMGLDVGVSIDIDGRPRGAMRDIGATEY